MAERMLTYECDNGIVRTEPLPHSCEYDNLGFAIRGNQAILPRQAPMAGQGMAHADQRLMLAKEAMAVYLADELRMNGDKINERRVIFKAVQMADRMLAQLAGQGYKPGQEDA